MKILFDECVPWPVHKSNSGHECGSVQKLGWCGIKNGDLIARAEGTFDLFITADRNLRYQQNLTARSLAIIELTSNDLRRIQAVAPRLLLAIDSIQSGGYEVVEIP